MSKNTLQMLSTQLDGMKRDSLVKQVKEQIAEAQISLFQVAPWDDDMRALPNDYARSALFTVRNKRDKRAPLQDHPVFHVNQDVSITYTGLELRAEDDELVWQQVLEYSKRVPIGEPIGFSMYQLCKDLDWPINGQYYKKAENCLSRLQATSVRFKSKRVGQIDSLSFISRFKILNRGKKNALCQVTVDPDMVFLFAGEHYSKLVWEKYRKLTPIARRLCDYFVSHKQPFPLKLETFRLMCGSSSSRAAKWKEQAKGACTELSESGLVRASWVHDDSIMCDR